MNYEPTTYLVSTMHTNCYRNTFIVPIEIEAGSPLEAAQKRFNKLASPDKCKALLVTRKDGYGDPQMVTVERKCEWVLS